MSARLLSLLSMLLVVLSVPQPFTRTVSAASDPCATPANPIACENSKPGSAQSGWDLPDGLGSATIEGFAADISVNVGDRVAFKVNTNASAYRIDIYRLGYYGGLGARKIATVRPTAPLPQMQPPCAFDTNTRLTDCGNWLESASWMVPVGAVSGVYIGKLVREDGTAGVNHIIFVVRNDLSQSDLLFQTSDATWQAYNRYGGYSFYYPSTSSRAYKVSYSRPFITRDCCDETFFFSAEYPMLRWLEANGYDVSYFTGVDTARRGGQLRHTCRASSARTSKPPAFTSHFSAATNCSGRPAGSRVSMEIRTARSCRTRRHTQARRSIRARAGPAHGAIPASVPRPTADGRRTR